MRVLKPTKQSHNWHQVALLSGLGLFALWSLSLFDTPQLRPVERSPVSVGTVGDNSAAIIDVAHSTKSQKRVLLSTHNRLFWYYPDTDQDVPLHSGQVKTRSYRTAKVVCAIVC